MGRFDKMKNVGSITIDGLEKVYVVVRSINESDHFQVAVNIHSIWDNLKDAVKAQEKLTQENNGRISPVIQVVTFGTEYPFQDLDVREDENYIDSDGYYNSDYLG
jgi:hypothetical protein